VSGWLRSHWTASACRTHGPGKVMDLARYRVAASTVALRKGRLRPGSRAEHLPPPRTRPHMTHWGIMTMARERGAQATWALLSRRPCTVDPAPPCAASVANAQRRRTGPEVWGPEARGADLRSAVPARHRYRPRANLTLVPVSHGASAGCGDGKRRRLP